MLPIAGRKEERKRERKKERKKRRKKERKFNLTITEIKQ